MPYINVKVPKSQVNDEVKKELISGLTRLVVNIMNRSQELTNIVIDEIEPGSWALGGKAIKPGEAVSFVNIKVSRGTTNPEEMSHMIKETKAFMSRLFQNHLEANYFIIDELNPAAWGFGDMTMTERAAKQV